MPDSQTIWLVEEVPGVPKSERFYISIGDGNVVWHGASRADAAAWALENNIHIDQF